MTLTPITADAFAGVDSVTDPLDTGWAGATEVRDFDVIRGRLVTRAGWQQYGPTGFYQWVGVHPGSPSQVLTITSSGGYLYYQSFDTSGNLVATSGAVNPGGFPAYATVGTPTTQTTYLFSYPSSAYRYNGSSFSAFQYTFNGVPVAPASQTAAAVTPVDNRLVLTHGNRVYFSDPGAPEAFTDANAISLHPNDGDVILSMVTWGDYVFIFKRRRFYVFYGTSVDGSGNPVFNIRDVVTSVGTFNNRSVAAGDDGVYFANESGVFKTTGGPPVKISAPLDAAFGQRSRQPVFGSSLTNSVDATACLTWFNGRLFLSSKANPGAATFVFSDGNWVAYTSVGTTSYATIEQTVSGYPVRRLVTTNYGSAMRMHVPTATTDNGTAILGQYISGFNSLGAPGRQSVIRETSLFGSSPGGFSVGYLTDPDDPTFSGLATIPIAHRRGLHRQAVTGSMFAFYINGVAPCEVDRVTAFVRESTPDAHT